MLFDAFLLDPSDRKYHIDGDAAQSESTLCFWQGFLRHRADQAIEDDACKNLRSDGQERYSYVIATIRLASFFLEQGDTCGKAIIIVMKEYFAKTKNKIAPFARYKTIGNDIDGSLVQILLHFIVAL